MAEKTQENRGLSAPVFAGTSVQFRVTCTKCGKFVGALRADNLLATVRVLLKQLTKNPQDTSLSPSFSCPDCTVFLSPKEG